MSTTTMLPHSTNSSTSNLGSRQVSVFAHAGDATNPTQSTVEGVIGCIRDGSVAPAIATIRAVQTDTADRPEIVAAIGHTLDWVYTVTPLSKRVALASARAAYAADPHPLDNRLAIVGWLKKALPAVTWGGTFDYRNAKGLLVHSGLIVIDLDDLPAPLATCNTVRNDPHCVTVFPSPTMTGAKIVMRVPPTDAEGHKRATFPAVAKYLKSTYNLSVDPSGADVCRTCFLSHYPAIQLNQNAVELDIPPAPPPVSAAATTTSSEHPPLNVDQVRELLAKIPAAPPYLKWLAVISAVKSALPQEEGIQVLKDWSPEQETGEYEDKWSGDLDRASAGTLVHLARDNGWTPSASYKAAADTARVEMNNSALWADLQLREFGFGPAPTRPVPRFSIFEVPISTSGNITTVSAQSKSGKTAVIATMIAAPIVRSISNVMGSHDLLGITGSETLDRILLHVDTEQSHWDHHQSLTRALLRAGTTQKPSWLRSFRLTGADAHHARQSLRVLLEKLQTEVGFFAIIIDGVGDLVSDVNEPKECNALVAELHDTAIRLDCPLIAVLHENPNDKSGKGRGHLGSQLERKSETVLRLKRTGDVTTMYASKTRGAPLSEKDGPKFSWNEEHEMHMSVDASDHNLAGHPAVNLRQLAEEVLAAGPLRHKELKAAIVEARGSAPKTAEKRIKDMTDEGIIRKSNNRYELVST